MTFYLLFLLNILLNQLSLNFNPHFEYSFTHHLFKIQFILLKSGIIMDINDFDFLFL